MVSQYALNKVQRLWGISSCCFDNDNQIMYIITESTQEQSLQDLYVRIEQDFRKKSKDESDMIYIDKQSIYYMGFYGNQGEHYLLGPMSVDELSFSQLMNYRHENNIKDMDYKIPFVSFSKAVDILSMAFLLVNQTYLPQEMIWGHNKPKQLDRDITAYEYDLVQDGKSRMSYQEELHWIETIENGTLHLETENITPENYDRLEGVGVMVGNNTFRQLEYMLVVSTTLASRAAIRGGMNANDAYQLSDVYFQKIAHCNNAMEMIKIYIQMVNDYSSRVRKRKENRSSDIVEQIKAFVSNHRKEKIIIQDIAKELGKNRSYISRRFSEETGMTIQNYILDEKLSAAANMLKYSNVSMEDIADYLHFSSSSYLGERFKKRYGVSPREYKKENRIIGL